MSIRNGIRKFFSDNLVTAKDDFCYHFTEEDRNRFKESGIFSRIGGALIIGPIFITTLVIDLGFLIGIHRITVSALIGVGIMIARALGILAGLAGFALCFVGAIEYSGSEPPLVPLKFFLSILAACTAVSLLFFLSKLSPLKRHLDDE